MEITRQTLTGKMFMTPLWDYLLIGSVWSFVALAVIWMQPSIMAVAMENIWPIVLLANSAHFAASTVRLYSKPEYYKEFSFLTFAFPAIALGVLSICVLFPNTLGKYLMLTYVLWSPFHFAKQIYGLSLMYTFRSGLKPSEGEKKLYYWVCMLPFLFAIGTQAPGFIAWATSPDILTSTPLLYQTKTMADAVLIPLVFIGPVFLWFRLRKTQDKPVPLIVPLMMFSNGIWWTLFPFLEAFVLSNIAHSIQYLAIMLVYHVREKVGAEGSSHGWFYHAARFYGVCVLLGYVLFSLWPYVFVLMGASFAQAALLVLATINIHHFIVDAYIWRLRVPVNRVALADNVAAAPRAS